MLLHRLVRTRVPVVMRIRVVSQPTQHSVDGIDLDRYRVGVEYEVGTTTGAFFLAEGWAVPVPDASGPADTAQVRPSFRPSSRRARRRR
jgi:nitrous oxide reductase